MPRNLPNGRQEYNVAIEQEKITVIEQITSDLNNFLMTRCTSDSHAGLRDIYMNRQLSEEEKETAVRNLQAAEKVRIMAAYVADKKSL